ncbi:MAG: alpha/beta fold hydrolase [Chloroflexales bacterium]
MGQYLRQRPNVGEPLGRAIIPLILGLSRRAMVYSGAVSHEQSLAGIKIHYFRRAGRPRSDPTLPVVLIHGIADSALTWAFTLGGLARIGPVYALDLPGFGQSGYPPGQRFATIDAQIAVLRALINEVIGHPALLVGNSMGGWIAARLAAQTPALVRGIVLLDPGGALLEGHASWTPFADLVAVRDLRAVRTIYRQMFGTVNPALYLAQLGFQALFQRDAVRHFVESADVAAFCTPAELQQITVPTALVWGERDTFLPAGSFAFFRDHLPNPQVLLLPGCGHLPQRERPWRLVRFVQAFARGL